jgi:DNA-binding MarR family transcriptional regulator
MARDSARGKRSGARSAHAGRSGPGGSTAALADELHSAAIHLLRRLRREDDASGLPAPQLSALSVIVFGGPLTLGALAAAEQVRPPTITKLVATLEAAGLVARETDPDDRRVVRVKATARGARLLHDGRQRRVATLAATLARLSVVDRAKLARALPVLERVVRGE